MANASRPSPIAAPVVLEDLQVELEPGDEHQIQQPQMPELRDPA
jgi:hypothetical protein